MRELECVGNSFAIGENYGLLRYHCAFSYLMEIVEDGELDNHSLNVEIAWLKMHHINFNSLKESCCPGVFDKILYL